MLALDATDRVRFVMNLMVSGLTRLMLEISSLSMNAKV